MSSANLARSLYSLLTPNNRNFFLIDHKIWVAYPDIFIPFRMVWMASSFPSMWSPFLFKILWSCESSFIKQSVFFDMLRWTSCSFLSVLLITGGTEAKAAQVLLEQIYNSLVGFSKILEAYLLLTLNMMRSPDEAERKMPRWFHYKGCNQFHG